jgi:hypothetical protein
MVLIVWMVELVWMVWKVESSKLKGRGHRAESNLNQEPYALCPMPYANTTNKTN